MPAQKSANMLNENQLFYAALWWAASLPGSERRLPWILTLYDKEPVTFPACAFERGEDEVNFFAEKEPVKWEPRSLLQYDDFFDSLYKRILAKENLSYTSSGRHRYLELRQSFATASTHPAYPDYPYSDEIEAAIVDAGIPRGALPKHAVVYAHDDGQLFVTKSREGAQEKDRPRQKWEVASCAYPGQPPLPHRPINLTPQDMDHCRTLTWESLYRVIPLEKGQKFRGGWIAVNGERCEHEDQAYRDDQVVTVGNNDFYKQEDLFTLTDREILDFAPALRHGGMTSDREEYVPGYKNENYNTYIEATDRPDIVRHLKPDVAFMIAQEPVQFDCGGSFTTAAAGDFIIRESKNSNPRVMPKEIVDSGRVRFILPNPKIAWKKPGPGLS